jgi:hypothetical protein
MKAFSVLVNGQKVATIGIGDSGVLSAIVNWVPNRPPEIGGEFSLSLGGLAHRVGASGEHLRWQAPSLGVGDEVTIRLVEVEQVDPPAHREESSPASPELLAQAGIAELLEDMPPEGEGQPGKEVSD